MNLIQLTEDLWRVFFSEMNEETEKQLKKWITPNCVIIGTGAHEFYESFDVFLHSFSAEIAERDDVKFRLENFICKEIKLDSESSLVYGKFDALGENKNKTVQINMNSRFTLVFHRINNEWKIVHVHESLPNLEQSDGEYYPKTLLKQVEELQNANEEMSELAQKDGLTGLANFRSFSNHWEHKGKSGWLFILDLDHFKQVNDTYGHLAGNEVLIKMGKIFSSAVRGNDLLCRMGGDEFLIFCSDMKDKTDATEFAQRLITNVRKAGNSMPYWTTVSIGAAEVTPDMSIEVALESADRSLYAVKRSRHGGYLSL